MNNTGHHIVILGWSDAVALVSPVRRQVFIEEQNVPEALEWDGLDDDAYHAAAMVNDNQIVGCGRLLPSGQIGRMAVLPEYRQQGIGTSLLLALEDVARKHHYPSIFLHAQLQALPFYQQYDYHSQGEVFFEADIPHQKMSKDL